MRKQVIAPRAIMALKQALTDVYWYKGDLRSFLANTVSNPSLLGRLDWNDYKRNIVRTLVDYMARNQDEYRADLLRLIVEVSAMEDFSHLARLEDGAAKVKQAKSSVEALRKLSATHRELQEEQRKVEQRREQAYQELVHNSAVQERLRQLTRDFHKLLSSRDRQARGYLLEKVLRELFALFDLDPKASFKIAGEQIDGAFSFEGTDYLLEARWEERRANAADLDTLVGKLSRKLDNTLGLFFAMNGFCDDAVKAHSSGRRLALLMDGSHLMAVLEGRIDLIQLLLRMRRHAAQTGNIYLPMHEIA